MTEPISRIDITDDVLVSIGSIAEGHNVEVYVVGGYVRDTLLGKQSKDVDIVVVGDGIAFSRLVANQLHISNVVVYEKFGTAMLPLSDGKIEFVAAREERYEQHSRKPSVKNASLQSDLSRRDFTVNALAASLKKSRWGELIDPFHGREDLDRKILRTPLEPEKTFDDDPLRMMRAVRFASQLQFTVE